MTCPDLTRSMLHNPIDVTVTDPSLDFSAAKRIADLRAKEIADDPMLLAWFDRKRGEVSPRVECCQEDKPGWLVYAESRNGDIILDINQEEYVFVYRS